MEVSRTALEERLKSKTTDELRAIADSATHDYTTDAREAAAVILAERAAHPESDVAIVEENVSSTQSKSSTIAKIASVIAALVVIRQVLRLLESLIFR